MKKRTKLAILFGTAAASLSLTGCDLIRLGEYQQKVDDLASQVKRDMINAGLDIYKYEIPLTGASDYYASAGQNGSFLSFPNDLIVSDVIAGEHKSLVVYKISNDDCKMIANLTKSQTHISRGQANYTGDIEVLKEVLSKDLTKLFSVTDLTSNTVLYSAQSQNEMTDDGMSL